MPTLTPANQAYLGAGEERAAAESGMSSVVDVMLLPGMQIYRFGNAADDRRWYSGAWWFGRSVHDALLQLARRDRVSLTVAGRSALAVPLEWSTMDVLLYAKVVAPLAAWSGTPRTIRPGAATYGSLVSPDGTVLVPAGRRPLEGHHGLFRYDPDRSMTQLYVPGLRTRDNAGTPIAHLAWRDVLEPTMHLLLPPV